VNLCLDTNAYAAFKRGHAQIHRLLEDAEEIVVPTIVLGELYAGFAMGSREQANLRELEEFLRKPGVTVAQVSQPVAERYGGLVKTLRAIGIPIPTNDLWIAATAMEAGARILSFDDHFAQVPAVLCIPLDPA